MHLEKLFDITLLGEFAETLVDALKPVNIFGGQACTGLSRRISLKDALDGVELLDILFGKTGHHGSLTGDDGQVAF